MTLLARKFMQCPVEGDQRSLKFFRIGYLLYFQLFGWLQPPPCDAFLFVFAVVATAA